MASATPIQIFQLAMFPGGIGYLELLIVFALILVLFGPERLPGIARKLGQIMEQLRKAAALFQHNLLAMDDTCEDESLPEHPDSPQQSDAKPKEADDGSTR